MREEETDLSFAEFDGSKRLYPAPTPESDISETGNYAESVARREGFEPPWSLRSHSSLANRSRLPLRFEEESQPEEDSMTCALTTGIWRRLAAYRGTQDGTQHRKRHPGGTEFWVVWLAF